MRVAARVKGRFAKSPLTVDPRGARGIVRVLDDHYDWWNWSSCCPKATPSSCADASVSAFLQVYAV
jgi:hypothetical protein